MAMIAVRIMSIVSVSLFGRAAILANEGHEQQAEHVEAGHEGGDDADHPIDLLPAVEACQRISSF